MKELASERYKRIAFSICYNKSQREDFYHHCILECLNSKGAKIAHQEGYLMQYFTTICKNQQRNENSNFNKLYNFKTADLPIDLQEIHQDEDTLNQRLLESDLQRYSNDAEKYIKQVVKIYLREGSVYMASKSTGISRATITNIINEYVRDFNSRNTFNGVQRGEMEQ